MKATLFTDAIIHTMESKSAIAHSMLVKDGKIVALNPSETASAHATKVSLQGQHVYPCLIDGHVHLLDTVVVAGNGFEVCTIEHGTIAPHTIRGVEEKLRAFVKDKPKNATLVGNNYILTAIEEKRLPTRWELDEWCGGRTIILYTIDGHASALSTAALQKLGIDAKDHNGILKGEAHDRMQGRMIDLIASSITPKILAKGCANFQNTCAEYGLSCIGALDGNGDSKQDITTHLITHLARHFDVAIRFYYQYFDIEKTKSLTKYQTKKRIGGCGDWEMDGAIGAHSAAFSSPYLDTGTTAPCYYSQDDVNKVVQEADQKGYQIACHAIGDVAIDRIVEALSHTSGKIRHRIEHCEFASDEAISKIAQHGWGVMAQPGYSWIDKRFLHTYEQFLTDDMIALLKFKAFVEKGVLICGSTDSPVQSLDPWQQMMGMTQFYREEESISPYEALKCYTVNPAIAMLEEDRGMLVPGRRADFFTGTQDVFTLSPEDLGNFRPTQTYYAGKQVKKKSGTILQWIGMLLSPAHKV